MFGSFQISGDGVVQSAPATAPARPGVDQPTEYSRFEDRDERIRSDPGGIKYPAFLPWYDFLQNTSETPQHRLVYRRMLADPYVSASLRSQVLAVAATEFNFEPYRARGVRKPSPRDAEISEFTEWALTERLEGGLPRLVWDITVHQMIDGFCLAEPVRALHEDGQWQQRDVVVEVKPKDVDQDFVLRYDAHRNIVDILGLRFNAGMVFDPDDFLISSHLPLFGNPVGLSAFRCVYSAYVQLDTVRKLRALACEKRALPIVAAKGPENHRTYLENVLTQLKSRNWLVLPPDVEIEVLNIAASSEEIYRSALADLREEVSIGITGATLQMMVGKEGGQRGNSKVHKDESHVLKWYQAHTFAQLLNGHRRGLIRKLVDWNYQAVAGYPRMTVGGLDSTDLKADLEIDKGLSDMGFLLSRHDAAERYGREEATDEADQLRPPMAQNPGLPDGAEGPDGAPDASPLSQLLASGFQGDSEQFAEGEHAKQNPSDANFTGWLEDSLGRKMYFQDGKHVPGQQPEQKKSTRRGKKQDTREFTAASLFEAAPDLAPAAAKGLTSALTDFAKGDPAAAARVAAEATALATHLGEEGPQSNSAASHHETLAILHRIAEAAQQSTGAATSAQESPSGQGASGAQPQGDQPPISAAKTPAAPQKNQGAGQGEQDAKTPAKAAKTVHMLHGKPIKEWNAAVVDAKFFRGRNEDAPSQEVLSQAARDMNAGADFEQVGAALNRASNGQPYELRGAGAQKAAPREQFADWSPDQHPREQAKHDTKRPGEFAPKNAPRGDTDDEDDDNTPLEPRPAHTYPDHEAHPEHLRDFLQKAHDGITAANLSPERRAFYAQTMAQLAARLPQAAHAHLAGHLAEIQFFASGQEAIMAAFRAGIEEGKKAGYPAEVIADAEFKLSRLDQGVQLGAGAYQHMNKTVYVDGGPENFELAGRYPLAEADALGVQAHELGHAVDGPDKKFSGKNRDWNAAWRAEIHTPHGQLAKLTTYASKNTSEGFAEFCRLVYGSNVPLAEVEQLFPKASKYFQEQNLWPK